METTTLLGGILVFTLLGVTLAALLSWASNVLPSAADQTLNQINSLLPQTQCGQCGYPGCRPYAVAIAGGEAINRCPPGGENTIAALADLLGRDPQPLDPALEEEQVTLAVIREAECIGCTLCIQACPVDAIIGAPQRMHTVISAECTGCDLCLEPCPMDCIDMVAV